MARTICVAAVAAVVAFCAGFLTSNVPNIEPAFKSWEEPAPMTGGLALNERLRWVSCRAAPLARR